MSEYVHWRNLSDTSHLRAEIFLPGEEKVLTIAKVVREEVNNGNGKKEERPVAYFMETNILPMVLNVTNCKVIEKIYDTGNVNDWVGKKIQVYTTKTKVGKENVPCLRVRPYVPTSSTPEYKCAVCGKTISKEIHDGSIAKYGKAYCSKECHEKDQNGENLL